jgi:integrase/recombinase XerD
MHSFVDDFAVYISSEKGLALNTIEAYERDVLRFIEDLKKQGLNHPNEIEEKHLIAHISVLKNAGYLESSQVRSLIAIKVFFRFLKREGILQQNISQFLASPKVWQNIPDVLSLDEVEKLLRAPNPVIESGALAKAVIELLYASGLRVSELTAIDLYDLGADAVKVKGKGNKERVVPVGKVALAAVDHYLLHFRSQYDSEKEKALFVSSRGKRLNRITVWSLIKKNAELAGIEKNVHPHTLRHSFATHLLDNGADLRIIQEMMGHADISSTDRYMHVSRSKIQESFDKFHPRG